MLPHTCFWKNINYSVPYILFQLERSTLVLHHTLKPLKVLNIYIFISIIFLLQVWNTRYARAHKHKRVFMYRNVCVFIYFCAWSFSHRTVGLK
jgi:hypothetical protein